MPKLTSWRPLLLATAAALLTACATGLKSGVDRTSFDKAVHPADDFYTYVNGNWIRNNPIPADYSRWGLDVKLRDDNLTHLRQIVEDLSRPDATPDATSTKLRDLYRTAMNQERLEQQGAAPVADEFRRIAEISTRADVTAEIAHLGAVGLRMVFGFYVDQDEKQADRYIVHLDQAGLGLPEREYYLSTTEDSKRTREQYHDHIAAMMKLLGDTDSVASAQSDAVLSLETQLAEKSRTPQQLRDAEANYHKQFLAELAALTPNFSWDAYVKTIDLTGMNEVVVGQPEFFQRFNELLASAPVSTWQAYLRWHLVHTLAPFLSSKFENEDFRFYAQTLRGVKEMRPRWKRVINTLDRQMGEALGKLYVEKYFPPQAKTRMDALVKNLLAAYAQRIETRDWMGPDTKKQALIKLAAINTKIGYPDKWRDYSALEIKDDSYVQNILRCFTFDSRRRLARLGQPVDRSEWHMSPPTVNAYYNSTLNEIVFPAGILQPPFFDQSADDAVNYGGIGAVIGHEITHGFDDQGSRSDAQGNLRDWWTPQDRQRFDARTAKLVDQYNACIAVDDLHVNGQLTLGENIADLGGITIAYAAYLKSLAGKPAPIIDGWTGPQRFFIGFAQSWCTSIRDADQRLLLRTDPHSPSNFRTLVPLSNFQPFYEAFNLRPGDPMYRSPESRVEIW